MCLGLGCWSWVLVECLAYLATPFLLLPSLRQRLDDQPKKTNWTRHLGFQVVGLVVTLAPILTQCALRSFGYGDAFEVVAIICIANLGWYFTVFSKPFHCENAAFAVHSSVVLFVCFSTQSTRVYAAAFLYFVIALWWLLENYWSRLIPKKLDGETQTLPIRGFALAGSIGLLVCVGALAASAGPVRNLISISGMMPTSGGQDGQDDMFARSGVGDGDMLTTGPDASAVGAVDTDQFIEGNQPSIYDMVSDRYDGPLKVNKKMSSAQSLSDIAKHMHNVKQAEQSGRTFRTVRNSRQTVEKDLDDRISDALFYVEGKVPTRFRVDCFHHFDGWDWTKTNSELNKRNLPRIEISAQHDRPWFVLNFSLPKFLSGDVHHQLKILRLDSKTLPAIPFLRAWHISKVDTPDLFRWNSHDLVRIRSGEIPSQTVIDVISHRADVMGLRSANAKFFETQSDPVLRQLPNNATSTRIRKLAKRLTQDIEPGWRQVEAIRSYLKSELQLAESQVPPEHCADTVSWFLENGAGPSYLFATTAVQLLRAAGFPTRLATGFVVEKKHYLRKSGQSVVTHENYHVWPEVCFDGYHWIPVEPTPGYTDPIGYGTFWQRAWFLLVDTVGYFRSRPLLSLAILMMAAAIFSTRSYWIAFLIWCHWVVFSWVDPKVRLRMTRRLIDARLKLFGAPRPSFIAIRDWFCKIDEQISDDFFDLWYQMQFSSHPIVPHSKQIETACRNLVSQLTITKIKEFANRKND